MKWLAFVVALAATPAFAAPSCRGLSVTPMAFGAYDVYAGSALTTTATISYSCPPPATPTVTIDAGLNSNGSYSPRYMRAASGDKLAYNVYSDSAHQNVWGATPVSVPTGNASTVTVYGLMQAGQDISVGSYSDTLTVTFNF